MESLYSQVVDILISNGDIDTLAALWKEISYVPQFFYLKALINKSTFTISDILSIQFPELKTIDWNNYFCTENFEFSIYKEADQFYNIIVRKTDPFVSLVNYYDFTFLSKLIETGTKENIINFFSRNRRRCNRGLKVLFTLIIRNRNIRLDILGRGGVLYWLLLGNKDLIRERKEINCTLYNLLVKSNFISYRLIVNSLILEAKKEKNYYPLLALKNAIPNNIPDEVKIFLISNAHRKDYSYSLIFDLTGVKSHKFIEAYINRNDVTEEDKAERLSKTISGVNFVNISLVNYDRVFHGHFLLAFLFFQSRLPSHIFGDIVEKYGFDETYCAFGARREELKQDIKKFSLAKENKGEVSLSELSKTNMVFSNPTSAGHSFRYNLTAEQKSKQDLSCSPFCLNTEKQ